jgi:cytochrome c oxidase subunit 2
MAFYVVVTDRKEFDTWLEHQAQPAQSPVEPLAMRGQEVFIASGCGACHTVRGTSAKGLVGPDLSHVGGRMSLGAGIMSNRSEDFLRWIIHNETIKPEVHMPSFKMLPQDDLRALAAYLDSLE